VIAHGLPIYVALEHEDDVETALARYEADMFPRAAEAARQSGFGLDLIFNADAPRDLVDCDPSQRQARTRSWRRGRRISRPARPRSARTAMTWRSSSTPSPAWRSARRRGDAQEGG
jgi:hypothetical protein